MTQAQDPTSFIILAHKLIKMACRTVLRPLDARRLRFFLPWSVHVFSPREIIDRNLINVHVSAAQDSIYMLTLYTYVTNTGLI